MPLIGYHASHEQFAPGYLLRCVRTPADFEVLLAFVLPDDVAEKVLVSDDPGRHAALYLHNVHRVQERFIDAFAQHVIPQIQ